MFKTSERKQEKSDNLEHACVHVHVNIRDKNAFL